MFSYSSLRTVLLQVSQTQIRTGLGDTGAQEVGSSHLPSPTQVPVLCAFMADDEHLRAELRYAQREAERSRRRSLLVAISTSVVIVLALVAYNTQNATATCGPM